MELVQTAETQLLLDVEALRGRYPNTQELYREVCAVMFFRYGLTPTANRLYQLVRKGSMSAPAEALAKFWNQLRERSRVTIEGPDLPDSLRTSAGELLSALWQQARESAAASLAALREEAEAQVASARLAEAAAVARADELTATVQVEREALAAARQEAAALRHQVGAGEALHAKLRERVDDARRELNEQHAWFKTVERDHAAALDKARTQLQAAREAADSARLQATQQLERERATLGRLEEALDAERAAAQDAAERHRTELRESLSQVAGLHQRIGALEAAAAATASARDRALDELTAGRHELAAAHAQAAAAAGRATALEAALRHATARAEPARVRNRGPVD